jgi:hypothetical protein
MSDQPIERPPAEPPQHPPPRPPGYPEVVPPPAYPPVGGYPLPAATRTNFLAVVSLVFGVLWIWWIGSILALVFGYIAKNQIDRSGGTQTGRGLAIAGIVLGWIGVATLVLFVLFGFGLGAGGSGTDDELFR